MTHSPFPDLNSVLDAETRRLSSVFQSLATRSNVPWEIGVPALADALAQAIGRVSRDAGELERGIEILLRNMPQVARTAYLERTQGLRQ